MSSPETKSHSPRLEYAPKDEKLTQYVTKFDGAVEALDHLLVIINHGK